MRSKAHSVPFYPHDIPTQLQPCASSAFQVSPTPSLHRITHSLTSRYLEFTLVRSISEQWVQLPVGTEGFQQQPI